MKAKVSQAVALLQEAADELEREQDPLRGVYLRELAGCIAQLANVKRQHHDSPPERIERAPVTVTFGPVPDEMRALVRKRMAQ